MKRTPFKRSQKPLRRTKLRLAGVSDTSTLKREIQALLRQIVIRRDGGCLLRGKGSCTEILQAEHLITRANSRTYADTRNAVCLCTYHHLFFKKQYSQIYWEWIEEKIGEKRWNWYKLARDDRSYFKPDWKLAHIALTEELKRTTAWSDLRAK